MNLCNVRSRSQAPTFGMRLIAGVVGVLAGLQYLLSQKERGKRVEATKPPEPAPQSKQRTNYFTIRQTKSELGYVYWMLQGFGEYRCFVLCDSWREAMVEACQRGSGCDSLTSDHLALVVSA